LPRARPDWVRLDRLCKLWALLYFNPDGRSARCSLLSFGRANADILWDALAGGILGVAANGWWPLAGSGTGPLARWWVGRSSTARGVSDRSKALARWRPCAQYVRAPWSRRWRWTKAWSQARLGVTRFDGGWAAVGPRADGFRRCSFP